MGRGRGLGRVSLDAGRSRAGELTLDELLAAARAGLLAPVVLVRGDRGMAEPLAERLAAALGELWQVAPVTVREPERLAPWLDDLRTFSLFSAGKIVVAVGTGVLADREAAAELLAGVREALPWSGGELAGKARTAALRLLQVLHLFELEPGRAPAADLLARLPDGALVAGRAKGAKAAAEELRGELAPLLEAALAAGLRGAGETEPAMLADVLRGGLPERHLLILVESAAPDAHPVVATLARRAALLEAGRLTAERAGGGIAGLDGLVAELSRETGATIRREAAQELAHRTLRKEDFRRGGTPDAVDADSAARFAAEFRKLAALAGAQPIERALVVEQVEDRGEQDIFQLLDAVGSGDAGKALALMERRLAGADDRALERLLVFGQLATLARRLVATASLLANGGVPAGERSYPRFKERVAPRLQGEIEGVAKNPLAGIHPYQLHRVYQAAARLPARELERLPALVLDTELRLKGDSGAGDAALVDLLLALARPELSSSPPPARPAGSRRRA